MDPGGRNGPRSRQAQPARRGAAGAAHRSFEPERSGRSRRPSRPRQLGLRRRRRGAADAYHPAHRWEGGGRLGYADERARERGAHRRSDLAACRHRLEYVQPGKRRPGELRAARTRCCDSQRSAERKSEPDLRQDHRQWPGLPGQPERRAVRQERDGRRGEPDGDHQWHQQCRLHGGRHHPDPQWRDPKRGQRRQLARRHRRLHRPVGPGGAQQRRAGCAHGNRGDGGRRRDHLEFRRYTSRRHQDDTVDHRGAGAEQVRRHRPRRPHHPVRTGTRSCSGRRGQQFGHARSLRHVERRRADRTAGRHRTAGGRRPDRRLGHERRQRSDHCHTGYLACGHGVRRGHRHWRQHHPHRGQ